VDGSADICGLNVFLALNKIDKKGAVQAPFFRA